MENEAEYPDEFISFLELIWGEGYLSPGGPAEISRILDGLDLKDKKVLDIGCGTGGITLSLATKYGAAKVVGIDIERSVLDIAHRRASATEMTARVEFVKVAPGSLPFGDGEFDLVFSKDAIIHIPDKEALFADIMRLLKPGSWFAASDWMSNHDGKPSPIMQRYLRAEGLNFSLGSPERYHEALALAGFTDITLCNRNKWYCEVARQELADIEGPLYQKAVAAVGKQESDRNIRIWRTLVPALETGELCPHHIYGRKPGEPG